MSLKAPVKYWTDKRRGHRWRAFGYTIMFALAIALVVLALWFEFTKWILPTFLPTGVADGSSGIAPYVPIGIMLASFSFLIWPLTIISRLLLSNVHLATDADERATMATTYLALLRHETESLQPTDRTIIINALFRPTATGVVKDDAAPPSIQALIQKMLAKK